MTLTPTAQDVAEIAASRRDHIQRIYIRVCRDSRFSMDYLAAAQFAAKVGGFHPMDVWTALPSLDVMQQIAAGTHPAVRTHLVSEEERSKQP